MFAARLIEAFETFQESDVHPHVPEERAFLYHALDGASTEVETLNFLNALVYSYKPKLVLETGTCRGFGTIAIAAALRANGFGKVYSVEIDPRRIAEARGNLLRFDPALEQHVEYVQSESLEFIGRFDGRFDLAFFDSETNLRHREFALVQERGLFNSGAVVMFHDTSRYRAETFDSNQELIDAVEQISATGGFEFPFSRGFRLLML